MPEKAGVSVIIPCYRCRNTIERAVASVAAQTLQPAEVVLVDDCSGDATLAALNKIQAQYPPGWIKVIASSENGGAGTARNVGWAAATQTYIAFLDSDDSWHPLKIEIQYGWMIDHPYVILTGHACKQVDSKDVTNGSVELANIDSEFYIVSKKEMLLSNRFPTRSVMLRNGIEQRFADGKRYSEDYQLWLDICCAGLQCYRSELPLANCYKADYGDAGLSAALWKMEKGELNTYWAVHKSGKINFVTTLSYCGWSLFKYSRRLITVWLRKVFQ